ARGGNAPAPSPDPFPSPKPAPVAVGERAPAAAGRAREVKAGQIARWCREKGALCCLTCAHDPHLPRRCASCGCEETDTTMRAEYRGAFESEFQMPWSAWTEQRAELETP